MLLRARIVVPVAAPPIADGAIMLSGQLIVAVGRWKDLVSHAGSSRVMDLGEVALLPGLINAHCHLDYTHMAGHLPPPQHFPDWIKAILALKAHWSFTEYAESWIAGAKMLLRAGTTTVADIEAAPELLPDIWAATPMRVISLLELTNVRSRRNAADILTDVTAKIDSLPAGRKSAGLAPHALYSTSPELMRLCAREARRRGCLCCTHVAESAEEYEMFAHRRGRLYDWLKSQRDMDDCLGTPVSQLESLGALGSNFLAVHANHLGPADALFLARSGSSVVHCPRSHAYFRHQKFPLEELAAAGVNLCLGTDSRASLLKEKGRLPELDMFAEMRALAATHPGLSPEFILRMTTINSARALGLAGQIGELRPGALAELITVPCHASIAQVFESMIGDTTAVHAVMIDGQWIITLAD